MAKLAVKRIPGTFGCEIENLDLRFLDDSFFDTIESAVDEHLVVVIPRQSIGPKSFMGLAQRFGEPETSLPAPAKHQVDPAIAILGNGDTGGPAKFHADASHLAVPPRCTLLYVQESPAGALGSTFADQRRAFEDLADERRRQLEGLVALHRQGDREDLSVGQGVGSVRHPLVRTNPRTRRQALYAVAGSSFGIEGMGDNEGRALLDDLARHSTQDKYLTVPSLKTGDVVVWDNASLLRAGPAPDSQPRTHWRITIKEDRPTL